MRVLILNETLSLGGSESSSIALANALVERGVHVFFCSVKGPAAARLNMRVNFISLPRLSLCTTMKVIKELANTIRDTKPHIIHSHGATFAVLTGIAAQRNGYVCPRILTHHIKEFKRLPAILASRLIRRYCDHIISISRDKLDWWKRLGMGRLGVSLLPNFVDCDRIDQKLESYNKAHLRQDLGISPHAWVVSAAGRLVASKRFDTFIRVLAACAPVAAKEIVGICIGDGPQRQALEKLAADYHTAVRIHMVGSQTDVFPYLAISNLVLFPSEHPEVLPMFLLESIAAGVPIVCSDIPGNRAVVRHASNGFLVQGSEPAYSAYVLQILQDGDLANAMSMSGKSLARTHFDTKKVVEGIMEIYNHLRPQSGVMDP